MRKGQVATRMLNTYYLSLESWAINEDTHRDLLVAEIAVILSVVLYGFETWPLTLK
jgi:hypothetical protein